MSFDRQAILSAAEEARRRGRDRKAIAGYERILAIDPSDASIHGKIAPLLARHGRFEAAFASFVAAATNQATRGFLDRALGVYQHAAHYLPREPSLWHSIAELHVLRERRADAVLALLEGSRKLCRRKDRPEAVGLLRRALEIDPIHVESALALAKTLSRMGNRTEAHALLETLATRISGRKVRAVRLMLFRLRPTPRSFWRWLRG